MSSTREPPADQYRRYRSALSHHDLPAAVVDLDAFDRNIDTLLLPARRAGKSVRVATKSLRCLPLIERIMARGTTTISGVMGYSAREASALAELGIRDILIAYPAVREGDCVAMANANKRGANASIVVDSPAQIEPLAAAARAANTEVPLIIDVDVAYRPLGDAVHVGVRRSPLRSNAAVVALARRIQQLQGVRFDGIMTYEAHVAGLPDNRPDAGALGLATRWMKSRATRALPGAREGLVSALRSAGFPPRVFNAGGTGSVHSTAQDPNVTEITIGSGFVNSHLFDHYRDIPLEPALFFATQVVRMPTDRIVTCHGGGYVASGASGPDRLPIVALPRGGSLLPMEGAGEVQTPVAFAQAHGLALGDPVFFRHAKAGELAEHFTHYQLVRGFAIEQEVKTYRGMGWCFL